MTGARIWDLHVHTTGGSADASLRAEALGDAARVVGIEGVLLTEHFRRWGDDEAAALSARLGVLLLPGREWATPLGHILAVGLQRDDDALRDPGTLRRAADAEGALLIAAHPFRYYFGPVAAWHPAPSRSDDPAEAARWELFAYVHAVETANGHCTPRENAFAEAVARVLSLPTTGGSDAHNADELGRARTVFAEPIADLAMLIHALRAGRGEAYRAGAAPLPGD